MFDAEDDDLVSVLVDAVENAEGAAASTEDARQLVPQRSPDPPRVREQRAGDELDHRRRDGLRELVGDRPRRSTSDDQL